MGRVPPLQSVEPHTARRTVGSYRGLRAAIPGGYDSGEQRRGRALSITRWTESREDRTTVAAGDGRLALWQSARSTLEAAHCRRCGRSPAIYRGHRTGAHAPAGLWPGRERGVTAASHVDDALRVLRGSLAPMAHPGALPLAIGSRGRSRYPSSVVERVHAR
jgi:hypothetical protein